MLTSTVIKPQCIIIQMFQNVELTKIFLYHFFKKKNELLMDFGEVLDTRHVFIFLQERSLFSFKIYFA